MRKIALLAVVAFAAACGSSSDSAPAGASIAGTVGTAPFTSASQLALVASGNACTIAQAPGVQLGVSLALMNVADVAGTCSQINSSCLPNSRNLQLIIAKVHVPTTTFPSTTAPPFTPGAYQYADLNNLAGASPPTRAATSRSSPAESRLSVRHRPARRRRATGSRPGR